MLLRSSCKQLAEFIRCLLKASSHQRRKDTTGGVFFKTWGGQPSSASSATSSSTAPLWRWVSCFSHLGHTTPSPRAGGGAMLLGGLSPHPVFAVSQRGSSHGLRVPVLLNQKLALRYSPLCPLMHHPQAIKIPFKQPKPAFTSSRLLSTPKCLNTMFTILSRYHLTLLQHR